jgi:hypothetical protein
MNTDAAYGSPDASSLQSDQTNQYIAAMNSAGGGSNPDISAQENAQVQAALNSPNSTAFQKLLGYTGSSQLLPTALGEIGIAGAQSQYNLNQGAQNATNLYNQTLAGYQFGQLGINQQQLGVQQTGLTEQQQLQNVQQPIQTSGLVGSLAASGALNTKGSTQQQQLLGAEQQYSNEELQNAQQQLNLLGKSNGMSQQEVYNQLQYATAQGDIQGAENPIQLLNSIAQVYAGGLTGFENAIAPTLNATGLNVWAPSQLAPGT